MRSNRRDISKQYRGSILRPTVKVAENDGALFVFGTPWGAPDACEIALKEMQEQFRAFEEDQEATWIGELPVLGLSRDANLLRKNVISANNQIFRNLNSTELNSGCEMLALAFRGLEMSWVQVGQPHLFILREDKIHTLGASPDMGFEFGNPYAFPNKLMGVEEGQIDFVARSLRVSPKDIFIVLSRSEIPRDFYAMRFSNQSPESTVQSIFDLCCGDNPDLPFFLSVVA